jgi:hypothetical protein
MMAAFAAAEIIVILLRILLQVENKRRNMKNSPVYVRDSEFMNLTDNTEAPKGLTAKRIEQESRNIE